MTTQNPYFSQSERAQGRMRRMVAEMNYIFGRCPACSMTLALDTSSPYHQLGLLCPCGRFSTLREVIEEIGKCGSATTIRVKFA